ncbi:MAG: tRNA (5-methylaminomethyl-2-thiouridine)(34)-methyltransferase MnmD [Alistipes sp.]|jgi:tRNA U34 5-methylaminomethyl-2-thiouridine-forming methyltransferase MnmC|nr:tRNA (5-methylaminomethyl-2-thiouridine)(34)-methyltransferase MnmD [Alistipes sp.]
MTPAKPAAQTQTQAAPVPQIEITADGSATLRSPLHGDTYHSLRGAVGEARHVFIEAGFGAVDRDPVRVLEAGLGSGLNAWLTLHEAALTGRRVEYTAVELHPVPADVAARLNYTDDPRFAALHAAPWGEWSEPAEGFRLLKLHADLAEVLAASDFSAIFDAVYWDAFAPDTQPELWTEQLFARVHAATAPGGVLVTYSSKGDVRRALRAAGFTVERLPGALGKRHMLKATKNDKKT